MHGFCCIRAVDNQWGHAMKKWVNSETQKGNTVLIKVNATAGPAFQVITPDSLFEFLHSAGIWKEGDTVVDLGIGTGAVARTLSKYGAKIFGVDICKEQIEQAKLLSECRENPQWIVAPAERTDLAAEIADTVLACQCFICFDKEKAGWVTCLYQVPVIIC